ncbi:hypothetical protein V8C42DRAFT_14435 [Trichoderma barbatum]
MAITCTAHMGNGRKDCSKGKRGKKKKKRGHKLLLYSHCLTCIPTRFIYPSTYLAPCLSVCMSALTISSTLVMIFWLPLELAIYTALFTYHNIYV